MSDQPVVSAKTTRVLGKMEKKARGIVHDHEALKKLLEKAKEKLEATQKDDSLLEKLTAYIQMVIRMLSNYLNGRYNDTPWQTVVMLIAGLLYFIVPLDAIPDFIPIGGWIDDATILAWIGKCFRDDLARYRKWEESNGYSAEAEQTPG